MLLKTKNLSLRNYFLALVITSFAIFSQFNNSSTSQFDELRFLGTGNVTIEGPCNQLGYRVVTHYFTLLWIRVGDEYQTEEPC